MAKAGPEETRRAGLRPDERDPDDDRGEPGSAGGGTNMAGTPGGGLAAGGLGGTNAGGGAPDDNDLDDAMGAGIYDENGDTEDGGPPYAGPSGGAVGGTPAQKRVKGGHLNRGIAPGGDIGDDPTIGRKPK